MTSVVGLTKFRAILSPPDTDFLDSLRRGALDGIGNPVIFYQGSGGWDIPRLFQEKSGQCH